MVTSNTSTPHQDYLHSYRFQWRFLLPNYWGVWLLFTLLFIIGRLPLPALIGLGKLIGRLFYRIGGSRLRITQTNIRLCFPELTAEEQEQLIRKNYEALGFALLEPGLIWWCSLGRLKRISRVSGYEEHIKPLLARGKGVILFGVHMTCIEAIARLAGVSGVAYNILYRVHDNALYEYLTGVMRRRTLGRFIPRKEVKSMLRFVNQGEIGIILPDQDMGRKRSIWTPFFGIPAATIPVTSDYAQQTGATVAMIQYYRDERGHYVLDFSPPLDNFPTGNLEADTLRVNGMIEGFIRQHPEQYLWQHRRFKHRPEGEAKLY
ncbi:lysophospholipid acyltransferase family protein [Aestuariirhabdus litorea]|uniref:Lipid A biosynthesis lauroyl acyltransferase n=1 Tax=Aestuariirhabdus litorea TaxID=2528527 RepID=A0A3P3VRH0_9GAMM|nr:lysophospholipid acyltransferase family protein [Aestuariirhabdus litorea]RRJ85382.1 lipid A biosynthesis lauroyl acyltransferase [Aestuariirhabdus litorea]RWW98606.1 lipid A biosynthesis lauroyl acyltransferase [Endozoicomonadaceae bacterium GTF-13]